MSQQNLAFAGLAAPLSRATRATTKCAETCHVSKTHAPVMSLRLPGGGFRLPSFGTFGFGRRFGGSSAGGMGGMGGMGGGARGSDGGAGRPRRGAGGAGGTNGGNVFTGAWAAYNENLQANPILTKALTSLVGFLLGDLLAQKFLGDGGDVDISRLVRMASFGFVFHGPTGHFWYGWLDKVIAGKSPLNVASKVAIDQVLWSPIFTAAFFAYLGFSEGKTLKDVEAKIRKDLWTGVKTSWKFWPAAHAVNFALIPTSQRLLYVNTLQVGYNVILSLLGNQ